MKAGGIPTVRTVLAILILLGGLAAVRGTAALEESPERPIGRVGTDEAPPPSSADSTTARRLLDEADALWTGLGGREIDHARALDLYEQAAASGDPVSVLQLGLLYCHGGWSEIERDEERCFELARSAIDGVAERVEDGDPRALDVMSAALFDGIGVAEDDAEGVELSRRSCAAGSALGCKSLGDKYFAGEGVTKDESRAASYWRRAQ